MLQSSLVLEETMKNSNLLIRKVISFNFEPIFHFHLFIHLQKSKKKKTIQYNRNEFLFINWKKCIGKNRVKKGNC